MHSLLRLAFAGAIVSLACAAPGNADPAQPQRAAPSAHDPAPPGRGDPAISVKAVQIPANGRRIVLEAGKGTLIRLARPANTVFIADPTSPTFR
jgi:hypothetical protein